MRKKFKVMGIEFIVAGVGGASHTGHVVWRICIGCKRTVIGGLWKTS